MPVRPSSSVPALLVTCGWLFTACGWFAGSQTPTATGGTDPAASGELASEDPADKLPKCKPTDLKESRGTPPWKVGDKTPGGWSVTAVDTANVEYIRVTFQKDAGAHTVEIAFNEGGEGDWSTKDYRLMPAPDQTPPEDLLNEAIAHLRSWQSSQTEPFVKKKAGIDDPYADLPPCGPDGKPL